MSWTGAYPTGSRSGRCRKWLRSWWRPAPAPEVHHAALLFRLERHAVPSPKLLAFGQHQMGRWARHSFLLTEIPPIEGNLGDRLARSMSIAERGRCLRHAGALLRRVHEAGCILGSQAAAFATVCAVQKDQQLALTSVDGLERARRPWPELAALDFANLPGRHEWRQTERMRFFLGYLAAPRLTREGRALARKILARQVKEMAR
jgi:hypothetical protein